jgi:hypothetical protein
MEKHIAISLNIVDDWAEQQGAGGVLSEMLAAARTNQNTPRAPIGKSSSERREDLREQVKALREQRKAASTKEVRALMSEVDAVGGATLRLHNTLERAIAQVPALVRATIAAELADAERRAARAQAQLRAENQQRLEHVRDAAAAALMDEVAQNRRRLEQAEEARLAAEAQRDARPSEIRPARALDPDRDCQVSRRH